VNQAPVDLDLVHREPLQACEGRMPGSEIVQFDQAPGPVKGGDMSHRVNGVLVSMVKGKTLAYGLFNLQDRGRLFVLPNVDVYEGQIIGLHSRGNDLVVNPTKAKQLTNVRASGTDEALTLTPPVQHTLEQALEFIEEDELVEVTPLSIRLRKKLLLEHERKRASRS